MMSEIGLYQHIREHLLAIQCRPGLYIGPMTADAPARLQSLLTGMALGLQVAGIAYEQHSSPLRQQVITARGWTWNAGAPVFEMRARGYTPAQMVEELLHLELDLVNAVLSRKQHHTQVGPHIPHPEAFSPVQTTLIYLLVKGDPIPVVRPVQAEHMHARCYRIIDQNPDPEHDYWPFAPYDIVQCQQHLFAEDAYGLVAHTVCDH